MLALKRSLLNREQTLENVLRALTSITSIYSLHVILLSKITQRYFSPPLSRPVKIRTGYLSSIIPERCR
jgi:hypothetical protein